jgi:hypothetical protein
VVVEPIYFCKLGGEFSFGGLVSGTIANFCTLEDCFYNFLFRVFVGSD